MEAAEPTMPLDEVFPERALGLCPEQGPVLPAVVGQSSWASGSWAGARAGSPCRGGNSCPDSGSPAKARAGAGAGGGGTSVPGAGGPAGTELRSAQCGGQYPAGLVSFGKGSGLDLPSVDPWVLHMCVATTSVGTRLGSGAWLYLKVRARVGREEKFAHRPALPCA